MATTEFSAAINQLAAERGVSPESIIEGVKQALAAAYRKDFGGPTPVAEEGEEPKDGRSPLHTARTSAVPPRSWKRGRNPRTILKLS